jgi:hypothetical protein
MKNLTTRIIFGFFALSLLSFTYADEPTKITWETLRDVTFKKKWSAEESMFILSKIF